MHFSLGRDYVTVSMCCTRKVSAYYYHYFCLKEQELYYTIHTVHRVSISILASLRCSNPGPRLASPQPSTYPPCRWHLTSTLPSANEVWQQLPLQRTGSDPGPVSVCFMSTQAELRGHKQLFVGQRWLGLVQRSPCSCSTLTAALFAALRVHLCVRCRDGLWPC